MTHAGSGPSSRWYPLNPLAAWLRIAYQTNANYLVQSAEKMPKENYDMSPGPRKVARTYGQIIDHLANFNYMWCAAAKGEKDPHVGENFEELTTKAALVQALKRAVDYCNGVYDVLTDASGMQSTERGRKIHIPRIAELVLNYSHN